MREPRDLEGADVGSVIGGLFGAIDMALSGTDGRRRDEPVQPEITDKRAEQLKFTKYADYMETPEWVETATRVKWAAGRKCQMCDETRRLHVHHLTYERKGREWWSDLIAVCDRCHIRVLHGIVEKVIK